MACASGRREIESDRTTTPNQAQEETIDITHRAFFRVSKGEDSIPGAIDSNPDTWWTAYDFAPQWLALEFNNPYPVSRIELTVAQAEEGTTTHEIWLKDESQIFTLETRLDDVRTADHDTLTFDVDPPRNVTEVRILTSKGQGWIAWREVRIFASSSLHFSSYSTINLGLTHPVHLTHAGDGSGRLFVIEKEGRIRIVRDDLLVETPFLDIAERVSSEEVEMGLFNVAFPPAYKDHKQFYVSYSNTNGDTVISRFTTSANPDKAEPDSEESILIVNQLGIHHNGGTIAFGPQDGYLYIGSGDGLHTLPEYIPTHAQNPGTLLGKILRIDVESGAQPYAIPPDNPFVSASGYAPEIWALGLRNSWGFAFDQHTGDLYIPDTGWRTSEEISFQPADSRGGENYGWPLWEGISTLEVEITVDNPVLPVAVYDREQGCAIVGGAVLEGRFIYGDFCTGRVWALQRHGQDKWVSEHLFTIGIPISSIGTDQSGNLYATGFTDGKIYRLTAPRTRNR